VRGNRSEGEIMSSRMLGFVRDNRTRLLTVAVGAATLLLIAGAALAQVNRVGEQSAQQLASGAPPIRVGWLLDKTGALAAYGAAGGKVGSAAVNYINAHGGIGGRRLVVVQADTESDASVAATKARQLVLSNHVDFLMGSNTSAVVLAVAPIAKELKTPYIATAGGALLTLPGRANRYVFDFDTDVRQQVRGVASYIKSHLPEAKDWATVVDNYSWGWDNQQYFQSEGSRSGLSVKGSVRVPVGTGDWLSYMTGKVPSDIDGVYFANFGSDFVSFIQGLYSIAPSAVKIGAEYVLSGQDFEKLGEPAEGLYAVAGYPQECDSAIRVDRAYRRIAGMNCAGLDSSGSDLVAPYSWAPWSTFWAIKQIIEQSGWRSKADMSKFIKTMEGHTFPQSLGFPAGPITIRARDHLSLKSDWLVQLHDGHVRVVQKLPVTQAAYPAVINYQNQPLP
jgi:branched-chain amino acid transport system substrate-binding protein